MPSKVNKKQTKVKELLPQKPQAKEETKKYKRPPRIGEGRKTKYKPELCKQIVDYMSKGYSYEAFSGFVGILPDALNSYAEKYIEFANAKKEAFLKCQNYWESLGIDNIISENNRSLNAAVWCFNMKNRFKWRDKHEITGDDGKAINIVIDELGKKL